MTRKGYGQFCPVAIALDVLGERWTLLVLREILSGSHRFNDIHRGVPLMSASLLSERLRQLELAELIEKRSVNGARRHRYYPTNAAEELEPIIMNIGLWGLKYMKTHYDTPNLDPSLLLWDMRRWIRPEHLPAGQIVMRIDLTDATRAKRHYWLVKVEKESDLDLCLHDPGLDVDVVVTSDIETLAKVWLGDIDVRDAVRSGTIELEGPPALRLGFYDWIGLSPFAHIRQ